MGGARIRAALEEGLAASGLPGVTAAALTPRGETVRLAVGRRGVDDPAPLAEDTQFWIASMTKAVTAVVALQLVAEGRLDLDEPVDARLPELAAPQVLEGFDADGRPLTRPAARPVTLRALLNHASGLAYDFTSPEISRWLSVTGGETSGREPPAGLPLLFDPGAGWAYGYGLDFTGRLIAAVAGQDLEEVFAERIFRPLGMSSTMFGLTADQRARLAPMHARLPDGGVAPLAFALPDPPFFMMGGAGLYSTASDYLRFLSALIGPEPKLLPPALFSLLATSQVTDPRPGAFVSAAPHLAHDFDAFPGQPTGWTMGFLTNLEPGPAGRSAGSLCWAGLANCYYWLDREQGAAGVMLAQLLPFADPGALGLFERLERAVYEA
jgi:CubicO group peptidase (beta-lactamase class C family)